MHRPTRVARSMLVTTLLCLTAFLYVGANGAVAQDKVTVVTVPINGSQILEMTKQQRIKDIDNKDQTVARVEFVQGSDFRKIMIIGGATSGVSRLVLTDNEGNKETYDILVELNIEYLRRVLEKAAPTANIQFIQGTGGTLILKGTVAQAADIAIIMQTVVAAVGDPSKVINALQLAGVQQVQLDVVIARVARSEARNLGFTFLDNGSNHFVSSTVGGSGNLLTALTNSLGTTSSAVTGAPNVAFGIFNNKQAFLGFLEALRTENLVKVIAQPKVTALAGQVAEFLSGGEQAVPVIASGGAGGGSVSGVDFKPFGTTVRFLPLVLGDGRIYLEVEPQFTFPDPSSLFSAPIPGTNSVVFGRDTQRVKTSAILEDGQTMAIGGMIFHQCNATTTTIPVLGDLPYLGAAFRTINYSDSEEELLILITPHLVDAMSCAQLPKWLPGEETRKPDDYELFLEGILEAPRGPREVWHGCTYVPAYKNSPTAGMYATPSCNGPRGACDLGLHMGPSCTPDCGCTTGCGQGTLNSATPGRINVPVVPPVPPAQLPATMPQAQHLQEAQVRHQVPVDVMTLPMAPFDPATSVAGTEQPVVQTSGSSAGAFLGQPQTEEPR